MREKRISWNVFAQAVYTIALPIAFQNLLSTTASMVDTIMIGSMGELSVAAVGICSQISSLFFSCYFGFAGGALLFFSQYWGAKSEKGINKTFGLSMSFMLLVGLLFGAVAVTKPEFLLGIYTDKKNIIEVAIPYIRIVGFAYPLQVLAVIISFLMPGDGARQDSPRFFRSCAGSQFCPELDSDLRTVRHAANGSGRRGGRHAGFRHCQSDHPDSVFAER